MAGKIMKVNGFKGSSFPCSQLCFILTLKCFKVLRQWTEEPVLHVVRLDPRGL